MSARNKDIEDRAIDARWFLMLKAINRPLLLNSLTIDSGVLMVEKNKVLTGVGYNPSFFYSSLKLDTVVTAHTALLQLRQQVCQEEKNKSIVALYTERIDEMILEQELLIATFEHDWVKFNALNIKLYGHMNVQHMNELFVFLQKKSPVFSVFKSTQSAKVPTSIKEAINLFSRAQLIVHGPDIQITTGMEYTSEKIIELWNQSLAQTMPAWKVVIDEQVTAMLVVHRERLIKIPPNLIMNAGRMRKLFVHEIGTHVYRREQGKKNNFQLCSIGLAGNQAFEEGLAILRAQVLNKKFHQFGGFDKYLTLAVATGGFDGELRDFNQTFTMMRDYFLERLNRKRASDQNIKIANNRSWNCTLRIFRGGNPTMPGCCFLRDKIYHEGNHSAWKTVEMHPEYFNDVMLGKFDPNNPLQREMVLTHKQ